MCRFVFAFTRMNIFDQFGSKIMEIEVTEDSEKQFILL